MTIAAALETVLLDQTTHDLVTETPSGAQVTASTRTTYSTLSEANRGAQFLLEQILDLGFCVQGGFVGAERTEAGHWRGELVDIVLAPIGRPAAYDAAA